MDAWRAVLALPRDCWTLSTASFVNRTGTMVLVYLEIYCRRRLGLSEGDAASVYFLCGLAGVATSPFAGRMSDALGPAVLIRLSLFGAGVVLLATPFAPTAAISVVLLVLFSALSETMRPATLAAIATAAPPEARRAAFALQRTAVNAGTAVGSLAGGWIADRSLDGLFFVDGGTSLLAFAFLLVLPFRSLGRPARDGRQKPPILPVDVLSDRRLTTLLVSILPTLVAFFLIMGPLAKFTETELLRPNRFTGYLFFVNTALIVLVEVPFNAKTATWRPRVALAFGAALCALGFGGYAVARSETALVATTVLWTFGEMILFPAASDFVARIAPPERRGAYMGWLTMTFGLAFMLGPALGLSVAAASGFVVLWGGAFVACALSAVGLFFFARR